MWLDFLNQGRADLGKDGAANYLYRSVRNRSLNILKHRAVVEKGARDIGWTSGFPSCLARLEDSRHAHLQDRGRCSGERGVRQLPRQSVKEMTSDSMEVF